MATIRKNKKDNKEINHDDKIDQVNVYFMRHGFSCANAASRYSTHFGSALTTLLKRDPPLTEWGAAMNKSDPGLAELINKIEPDIVICSPLLRAIETAYWSTRNTKYKGKIYVVPFIGEMPNKLPTNNPRTISNQKEKLKKLSVKLSKIDFSYVKPGNKETNGYFMPSYKKFIEWLQSQLFTFEHTGRVLKVIAVSHGTFLRRSLEYCKYAECRIKNNSVILQIFKTKSHSKLLHPPVFGSVSFDGIRYEGNPKDIGIERCKL